MECQICYHPESGNHYGTICCRACAAFFRRTVQQKLKYECRQNGSCTLKKETRYCCRFCRMKRCVELGMVRDEVPSCSYDFYVDSSDYRPEGLLEDPSEAEDDEFFSLNEMYNNYGEFVNQLKNRINFILKTPSNKAKVPYKLTLFQEASLAYAAHETKWPNYTKEGITFDGTFDMNECILNFHKEYLNIARFCMEITPFSGLPIEQKWALMKRFFMNFMILERSFITNKLLGNVIEKNRIVALNGYVVDYDKPNYDLSQVSDLPKHQLDETFLNSQDRFVAIFTKPFKRFKPDFNEFLYILLVVMWNLEGKPEISKDTQEMARTVLERLSEELHCYYKFEKKMENYASRLWKLRYILCSLDRTSEIREQDMQLSKTFDLFKIDIHLKNLTI